MNPEEAPKTPPEETPPQSVESPPAHSPAPPDKPKSKSRPVKVYLTVLFCVALLLLLISFVMQQPSAPSGPKRLHQQHPGDCRPPAGKPTSPV